MNYSLDKLPDGYALLERPRIVNPDIVSFDYRWAHHASASHFSVV